MSKAILAATILAATTIPTAEERATWKTCGVCGYLGPRVRDVTPGEPRCHADKATDHGGCLPHVEPADDVAPLELGEVTPPAALSNTIATTGVTIDADEYAQYLAWLEAKTAPTS